MNKDVKLASVAIIAKQLMAKNGLKDWSFSFSQAKKTFGYCNYKEKRITLSEPICVLNEIDRIKKTILHEIAHALTPGAHHGYRWKMKCREIGLSDPERCYSQSDVSIPKSKYVYRCINCGAEFSFTRKLKRSCSCTRCSKIRRYDPKRKLELVCK